MCLYIALAMETLDLCVETATQALSNTETVTTVEQGNQTAE